MSPTIAALHIYPVKGCRGIRVHSARLTACGLEHDRLFCIVDVNGINFAKREAISKRKLPTLATISTSISDDGSTITLTAPGMQPIQLSTAAPTDAEELVVEASGRSTTTDGGWKLGEVSARVLPKGSAWMNEYLNHVVATRKPTRYALVRCERPLRLADYPPIFPLIAKAAFDSSYALRLKDHERRFADFAPLLLVNRSSAAALSGLCQVGDYPIGSFRGNVVIEGAAAWEEESWSTLAILDEFGDGTTPKVELRKIKECPRCTVPCRDEANGEFLFKEDKLKMWKVLKKAFPRKFDDPEWGTWSGPFFGVYYGVADLSAAGVTLHEGDRLLPLACHPWDLHLPSSGRRRLGVVGVAGFLAFVAFLLAVMLSSSGYSQERLLIS